MSANIIALVAALWSLYSLFCVFVPLGPFPTRGSAASSSFFSLLVLVVAVIGIDPLEPGPEVEADSESVVKIEVEPGLMVEFEVAQEQAETDSQRQSALKEIKIETKISDDVSSPCVESGDVVAVKGEYELRTSPSENAPKLKNEKASRILNYTLYHSINGSTTVRRLCSRDGWTEVRIATPEWLTHVKGWVPNDVLRVIERTASGGRIYVEEDFLWDIDTSRFRAEIVTIVNKIVRENDRCGEVDTSSVAKSPSRSKPGDPVFFVTCGTLSTGVFNVWFRPTETESGRSFAAKKLIGASAAANACENAAKQAAVYPSTVEFSRFRDLTYETHASGRVRMTSTFTAKNAFNLELKYWINCLFDGRTLIEATMGEDPN